MNIPLKPFLLCLCLLNLPLFASHFRGGNVHVKTSQSGVASFTYETLWRKGTAYFPFDGVQEIRFYAESDTTRSRSLASVFVNIGNSTVFRDVTDQAFDMRRQVVEINLPALGLAPGRYVARWRDCCRIAGIANAPEDDFSLETLVIYDGSANASPIINSKILTIVGKGLDYSQNLNAYDPEGTPLTYTWIVGASSPNNGPSSQIPGIKLGQDGQVLIPAASTATLRDINTRNPAGDYVFKVRITDASGSFSERDVLLDVVQTTNLPPQVADLPHRVLQVGEVVVLPITATDPNSQDLLALTTSALPDNAQFVATAGNPATATLVFRPSAAQIGVFGINVEARDNGVPNLTTSKLVTFTVQDPANHCPVLQPIGNRSVNPGETLSIQLHAADADSGQSLAFSASFLPPGAQFNAATATFTYTPTTADIGIHGGIVFEVRDSATLACVDRETIGIAVQPANRYPQLDPIADYQVTEGQAIQFRVHASDPDGDALTYTAFPLPPGAVFEPAERRFSWAPVFGQRGIYTLTFQVSDSGTPALSATRSMRIQVVSPNQESCQIQGLQPDAIVSGPLIVSVVPRLNFPVTAVGFFIDDQQINEDLVQPYYLGAELDGLPAGYDTTQLGDGSHRLTVVVHDSSGSEKITELDFHVANRVPPVLGTVLGLVEGAVVAGTIYVETQASDDHSVPKVDYYLDDQPINTDDQAPFYLNGDHYPTGVFNVSCKVCLQVGDQDSELEVIDLEHDGTLDEVCAANRSRHKGPGTPDRNPPSQERVCEALSGPAQGLCNAYCEAQDCDLPGADRNSCEQLRENFYRLTGLLRLPCEEQGECIEYLTLAVVGRPDIFATFDHHDFTGDLTTFQIPVALPNGFDTTTLTDGPHTLRVVATDNLGLTTERLIHFVVRNHDSSGFALSIVAPSASSELVAGQVFDFTAAVSGAFGATNVSFFANGQELDDDAEVPYASAFLVPDGIQRLELYAQGSDANGTHSGVFLTLPVRPRSAVAPTGFVTDFWVDDILDGRIARDAGLNLKFDQPVDPTSLTSGIRVLDSQTELPVSASVDPADPSLVHLHPQGLWATDSLLTFVVQGVRTALGAPVQLFSNHLLTAPDRGKLIGQVLDNLFAPVPGLVVEIDGQETVTDETGAFAFDNLTPGAQHLIVYGGESGGKIYPPMAYGIQIAAGIHPNSLPFPVFVPPLDPESGLEIVDGIAQGDGILRARAGVDVSLDLRDSLVLDENHQPYTGRMSISPVIPEAVPMPSPPGVYQRSFVTVQPGGFFLDPPAPIVYPNTEGAEPGEVVPLWHFDHDLDDWNHYGDADVSADGQWIVSRPGQGLPATGWGAPQPPMTYTDVTGIVVDNEDSPLHGVRVASGNIQGLTRDDGTFTLERVPAGREGSPSQIKVTATATDITGATYHDKSGSFTAVQKGTTAIGNLVIKKYAPVIDKKIIFHGDFSGKNHIVKKDSPHAGEARYKAEVKALQQWLADCGLRQGGGLHSHGELLKITGTVDANTLQAIKLTQSILTLNGNGGKLGGDGAVGKITLGKINAFSGDALWEDVPAAEGVNDAYPGTEIGDGYGTPWMADLAANPQNFWYNDISLPKGGRFKPHGSHQTGIDVDIPLLTKSGGYARIDMYNANYDRSAAQRLLEGFIDLGITQRRFFNDEVLLAKTYKGQPLCTFMKDHHHHFHIRIDLSKTMPTTSKRKQAKQAQARVQLLTFNSLDVPTDQSLRVSLGKPFNAETLNATTVKLTGPQGPIAAVVSAEENGLIVALTPAAPLAFDRDYQVEITTAAIPSDGVLLTQPLRLDFHTETMPSLRLLGLDPESSERLLPLDPTLVLSFDGPVDPASLTDAHLRLEASADGQAVPLIRSLDPSGQVLTLQPAQVLAEISDYRLLLTEAVRGRDGSALKLNQYGSTEVLTFGTGFASPIVDFLADRAEIQITRADLAPQRPNLSLYLADGRVLDGNNPDYGNSFHVETPGVVRTEADGLIQPIGNGETLVLAEIDDFESPVRVFVTDVFPASHFLGARFALAPDAPAEIVFDEALVGGDLAIDRIQVLNAAHQAVSIRSAIAPDGHTLRVDAVGGWAFNQQLTLSFDLLITDGKGVTYAFPQEFPFASASRNLGFELGNLTGFSAVGDTAVVDHLAALRAPEGNFMALMTTGPSAEEGRRSGLSVALPIPRGATRLVFTYNFLTDEVEQGQPFNDRFRASVSFAGQPERTLLTVSRDAMGSSTTSTVPGYDRMTNFRNLTYTLDPLALASGSIRLDLLIEDAGDASIDSAVLLDHIHFE